MKIKLTEEERDKYQPGAKFRLRENRRLRGKPATGVLVKGHISKTPISEKQPDGTYKAVGHRILPNAKTNWWVVKFDDGVIFDAYWWEALEILD